MNRVSSALSHAALIVGAALLFKAFEWAGIVGGDADEIAQRFIQVTVGIILLWFANRMPKGTVAKADCPLAKEDQMRRFAGQVLFLGGIGYVLTWIIAPYDVAAIIAVGILGFALTLVLGRWAVTRISA